MSLIAIIITIVAAYFLFTFPKQMFTLLGIFVFICICFWYFAISAPEQERKSLQASVVVSLKYDTTICGSDYPLYVNIQNKSNKTVNEISWDLNIYVPGYSTDLSGIDNCYTSDKILKPGEQCSNCYRLPSSDGPYSAHLEGQSPSKLKYEVDINYIN